MVDIASSGTLSFIITSSFFPMVSTLLPVAKSVYPAIGLVSVVDSSLMLAHVQSIIVRKLSL